MKPLIHPRHGSHAKLKGIRSTLGIFKAPKKTSCLQLA